MQTIGVLKFATDVLTGEKIKIYGTTYVHSLGCQVLKWRMSMLSQFESICDYWRVRSTFPVPLYTAKVQHITCRTEILLANIV